MSGVIANTGGMDTDGRNTVAKDFLLQNLIILI